MQGHEDLWYEAAKDNIGWRKLQWEWKQRRISEERVDTQQARQRIWNMVASEYNSSWILNKVWGRSQIPTGARTQLEGLPDYWIKQVIWLEVFTPEDGSMTSAPNGESGSMTSALKRGCP